MKDYEVQNMKFFGNKQNTKMTENITYYKDQLEYINTKAYKNKVLKE